MKPEMLPIIVGSAVAIFTIASLLPFQKKFLKPAFIAGVLTFVLCWVMNYFVVPFPEDVPASAFGNGLSGFMGGFMGGYVSLKGAAKHAQAKAQ